MFILEKDLKDRSLEIKLDTFLYKDKGISLSMPLYTIKQFENHIRYMKDILDELLDRAKKEFNEMSDPIFDENDKKDIKLAWSKEFIAELEKTKTEKKESLLPVFSYFYDILLDSKLKEKNIKQTTRHHY